MTAQPSLVLGYDRTEQSRYALSVATDLALRLDAHLHVVHIVDLRDYPIDPDSADWEQQGRDNLADEVEAARAELAGWSGQWTYHQKRGDPVRALLAVAAAHDALMIVVGTHGAGMGAALQHLMGGATSVSHGLLRHHRPVLVVPVTDNPNTTVGRPMTGDEDRS
jgi:nucleotide-binding universal stress UspA family protein